jgi:HSP20 family protein
MKSAAVSRTTGVAIRKVSADSLFKQMSEWSNRIAQRAYEVFASSGFTNGHDLEDWFKAERELLKPLTAEVTQAKDKFIVRAQVPGFDAKDLIIYLNGPHLVIEGKHETTKGKTEKNDDASYGEHKSQQIYQMIELPAAVLTDKARAELKNGVLELKLPKAEKQLTIDAA